MKYLFCLLFLSQIGFANILVQELNLDYSNSTGEGNFQKIVFPGEERGKSEFHVEVLSNGETRIKTGDQEISLSFLESYIKKLKSLVVKNLNVLHKKGKTTKIHLKKVFGSHYKNKVKISNLFLENLDFDCNKDLKFKNAFKAKEVLKICLKKADGKLLSLLYGTDKDPLSLKESKLKISKNHFNLETKLKAKISGKVKIIGEAELINADKALKIYIKSAKLGILGVKRMLLSMIRNQEISRVRVEGSFVFINLE